MTLRATTWQTVGPFFSIGLERLYRSEMAGEGMADEGVPGERVCVHGRVLDGDLLPVPDAVLEIWQADTAGRYARPEDESQGLAGNRFRGYGRVATNDDGRFYFSTIKPGAVAGADGALQAPHAVVGLMMRGLLRRLVTRFYFPDERLNSTDAILQLIALERRRTLLLTPEPNRPGHYTWDIHLQGADETVFFDF
jgi:protocatechuate 3,4-dioxygenase, alpha subunit